MLHLVSLLELFFDPEDGDKHCLHNRLTDGGKFVSPTHRPHFTLQKHFSAFGTHFCYKHSETKGLVRPEVLGQLGGKNSLIGSRTYDLPACSINHYSVTLIKVLSIFNYSISQT
jgi:hypothetical protein